MTKRLTEFDLVYTFDNWDIRRAQVKGRDLKDAKEKLRKRARKNGGKATCIYQANAPFARV